MSRQTRYRWMVTGVTAGLLTFIFGSSYLIAALITQPRTPVAGDSTPSWLDELIYGGDE